MKRTLSFSNIAVSFDRAFFEIKIERKQLII